MNVINVGFDSNYWSVLVEGSDKYKSLSSAVENGNAIALKHMFNVISSVASSDINTAYREAHNAVHSAEGNKDTGGDSDVVCPFCNGDGVVEFEYTPAGSPPWDSRDLDAPCDACDGDGTMSASDLFKDYAENSHPEHVVMSVIRGNMTQAKDLAKAVMNEIESHSSDNIDKSAESIGD